MRTAQRGKLFALAAASVLSALSPSVAHADPPPEQTGFQLALRTGVSLPFGTVSSSTSMSDALGPQFPVLLDIGTRITPNLFIGAFLGGSWGGTAGKLTATCHQYGIVCDGLWFRGGLLAEYGFHPDRLVNPWIGYGIGYEVGRSTGVYGRNKIVNTVGGLEFAHLLAGLDFRLHDWFGIGPFVDGAFGLYNVAKTEVNSGGYILTSPPEDKSIHLWLILGVRIVMRP